MRQNRNTGQKRFRIKFMAETEGLVKRYQGSTDQSERDRIFSQLYNRYRELVRGAARRYGRLLDDAQIEDVSQETFVFISQNLNVFKWITEYKFRSWLYNTAVRKCQEEVRRLSQGIPLDEIVDSVENPPEEITYEENFFTHILEEWRAFDAEGYWLNYLFYVRGKTDKEVASILRVASPEAARKKRKRALQRFKDYLKNRYGTSSTDELIEEFSDISADRLKGKHNE
jgi:RNA polymerase sigma factor (sigma-70 family)